MPIKKVFDRNGITLYHGDCMELMKDMPAKAFQMAIVDPPYGGGNHNVYGYSKRYMRSYVRSKCHDKNKINWDVAPSPDYFNALFKCSARQIIWGGNYFTLPIRKGFVIWDKLISNDVSFSACEYAWVSWPMNAKIFRFHVPQRHEKKELFRRFHPTQKPEALYCWLLQMFAKPGDTILDTHAGSCTSLVAAYQMGFPAVGIEIDAGYCEKAVERLEIEMQQGKLF